MSEEEKENKSLKIKLKPDANLNSYHHNIFSQIDKKMMEQGSINVLQTLGTNSIQQILSDYQKAISSESFKNFLTNVRNSIPEMTHVFTKEMSDYNKTINESLLSHLGSITKMIASVPIAALSNLNSVQNQLLNSLPQINESYSNALYNMMEVQKTLIEKGVLSSFTETVRNLTKNLNLSTYSTISEFVSTNKSYLSDSFSQSYTIQGNSLIIEKEKYNIDELRTVINTLIEESGISQNQSDIKKSLTELDKSVHKITDNKLKLFLLRVIWNILIPIILIMCTPQIQELTKGLFNQKSKTVLKKITVLFKDLNSDTKQLLNDYRIVSAKILNVREHPKQRSKLVASLYFGQLVLIKKVQKNWTLIQIVNDFETEKIEGWVFSRYLKKIK